MFEGLDQASQEPRKMMLSSCPFRFVKNVISVSGAIRLTAFRMP